MAGIPFDLPGNWALLWHLRRRSFSESKASFRVRVMNIMDLPTVWLLKVNGGGDFGRDALLHFIRDNYFVPLVEASIVAKVRPAL